MLSLDMYTKFTAQNDFELNNETQETDVLEWNTKPMIDLQAFKIAILLNDDHTICLENRLNTTVYHEEKVCMISKKTALEYVKILASNETSTLIVKIVKTLTHELSKSLINLLFENTKYEFIINLSSLRLSNLVDMDEDFRDLFTYGDLRLNYSPSLKDYTAKHPDLRKVIESIKPLESSFELSEFEQMILDYSTQYNIPLCILSTFRLSTRSKYAAIQFERILPVLNIILNKTIDVPTNQDYNEFLKKDSFLYNTELMYT